MQIAWREFDPSDGSVAYTDWLLSSLLSTHETLLMIPFLKIWHDESDYDGAVEVGAAQGLLRLCQRLHLSCLSSNYSYFQWIQQR